MSHVPISIANAEHYRWGGPNRDQSDGWFLLRTPELAIIEELMPPGASETRHHHLRARQFFYALEGELCMEIEGQELTLRQGQGIEIAPGKSHQAFNRSQQTVRFLVTSQPPSHGDRVEDSSSHS